jgi:uncharacterized protein
VTSEAPEHRDWQAQLRAGTLSIPACARCGRCFFPGMCGCPHCGSPDLTRRRSDGGGELYSWIVVHRTLTEAFTGQTPYAVVAVDLDVGARVFGRWLGGLGELDAGLAVRARPYLAGTEYALGFVAGGPA